MVSIEKENLDSVIVDIHKQMVLNQNEYERKKQNKQDTALYFHCIGCYKYVIERLNEHIGTNYESDAKKIKRYYSKPAAKG